MRFGRSFDRVKAGVLTATLATTLVLGAPTPGAAQEEPDTVDLEELERRIDALTREIEEMRLGQDVVAEADTSVLGFGPAASKVYKVQQGVSIGGYGEVLYENFDNEREDGTPSGVTDRFDALRGIIYVGYKFNDRILFNTEIEFEHASTGQAGSASLEFAYLDYRLTDAFGLRAGLLLSPMGFLNELHEPPIFLGTERPVTETVIIPSTWRENGIGFFGEVGDVSYRAYVLNGLDGVGGGSSNAGGFGASGLRGGRQKGSKAVAEDLAGVGRIDYTGVLGLTVGTSLYVGNSAQNRTMEDGRTVDGTTLIWEGHAEYAARGFDLRGLFALASVDDVTELNALKGLEGTATIGERLVGGYLQGGYDVFRVLDTEHELMPYLRWEKVNTHDEVPDGFAADPARDQSIFTFGLQWKPIPQVVTKLDYQMHSNDANTGVDQFNVAVGYLF